MITPDTAIKSASGQPVSLRESSHERKVLWSKQHLHWLAWIYLFLACLAASWFSYQYFLVPQSKSFTPDWQGAQWVQAVDGNAPVAYFRYSTSLDVQPDSAFVTLAASQVFSLYVNGNFIGTNQVDFTGGDSPRAYMYDVTSALQVGVNVIALRVANVDKQTPAVRVSFGISQGEIVYYHGTGDGWQATAQSAIAYPRYATAANPWAMTNFNASSWPPVQNVTNLPVSPMLQVNPLVYEQPIATSWMSAGNSHQACFVRQVILPLGVTGAWLRLAATGTAHVFINGNLLMIWNAQPPITQQNPANYLSENQTAVQYRTGLGLGVYDISSYLHAGVNTIAVYVTSPGVSAAQVGLDNLSAAMSLDMLVSDFQGHSGWITSNAGWHVSPQPVDGWTGGSPAALAWSSPTIVGRPGAISTFYLLDSSTPRNTQLIPLLPLLAVVLISIAAVIGLWLLVSLFFKRRYNCLFGNALETMNLAYLPAIACEVVLVVLSHEPQMPQPFPYTWFWGLVLIMLVAAGYLVLWLNAGSASVPLTGFLRQGRERNPSENNLRAIVAGKRPPLIGYPRRTIPAGQLAKRQGRIPAWLRMHWALIPLVLLAVPLICYNLSYEPYWQDELTSYFAARGILAHGLPLLPSGFLYPKGELYSYMLALSILIFGDQGGALRIISVVEYLVSLPLLYAIGCYFFDRRIALLATAMLALSPYALIWGRQVRMYEQAQLLTLLVVYLFYKAWQERQRVRLVYLSIACLIAMYLSHEETFIVLPAIVLCVLMISRDPAHRLPAVLYQKHWWFAALIASSVIGLQLLIVYFSHPPILGTDHSQRPLIQLTTTGIPYYIKLMFFPMYINNTVPWITVNSVLAVVGCIWALRSTNMRARYCAVFLLVSFLTLVLVFTLNSDRYIYPLLPVYYLIGSYALLTGLRALWRFAQARLVSRQSNEPIHATVATPENHLARPVRIMAVFTASLVCASVLVMPMLPLSGYNLFISKQTGLSFHRHYPDYDVVGQYIQQHWRKGDIVIAVSPAVSVLYYVGHVDYFLSLNRALYLFEQDGRITDTPTGSIEALLNQDDLESVLATNARIWIISDNGRYQGEAAKRFTIPPDFHIVYEGFGAAIYFRGS
jgi:hypothetical protein